MYKFSSIFQRYLVVLKYPYNPIDFKIFTEFWLNNQFQFGSCLTQSMNIFLAFFFF